MTTKINCTFTATGTTPATGINRTSLDIGPFSVRITGAGTVALEFSTDGTNWFPVSTDSAGTPNSYIVGSSTPVAVVGTSVAPEWLYRFNVTAYTSTVTAQIFQGGQVVA